ncbi:grasp-with-spasm system ATP-grasp peptide maturase [Aquimarina sp. 2201CG1-2-11]|uniref:grasp-with-spasm system ATP-grasp peptide maturase n=1 Tax=Aquimarina discodermiae TaxID=3231043 RepID=UPI0034622AFD
METKNQILTQHIYNHLHDEWQELVGFLVRWFKDHPTIPFIGEYGSQDQKLKQLEYAKKAGLQIPNTFITSSKKDLIDFYNCCHHTIITKGIESSASYTFGNISLEGYTEEVTKEFIDQLPNTFFPSLFQENIKKAYELRIFFLKDTFYSMAVFSQQNEQTKTDMRKYDDSFPNRTVPYILPLDIEQKLLEAMNALGLTTGSIDMIVDDNEGYCFLEVNPSGQFGMVSVPCNYYIEEAIAKQLL